MKRIRIIIGIYILVMNIGCVSIDKKAWSEPVETEDINNFLGRYENNAIYYSQDLFLIENIIKKGDEQFSNLINFSDYDYAKTFELIINKKEIEIIFELGEEMSFIKTYATSDGLNFNDGKSITIISKNGCDMAQMGVGCGTERLGLFLNSSGDLIAVNTKKFIGLFGIFPFAWYVKYILIFQRIEANN